MRSAFAGARWLSVDTLHLTLVFLGSTHPGRVGELARLADAAAATQAPFTVMTGLGGGREQTDGDGVAWLQLQRGGAETGQLGALLEGEVAAMLRMGSGAAGSGAAGSVSAGSGAAGLLGRVRGGRERGPDEGGSHARVPRAPRRSPSAHLTVARHASRELIAALARGEPHVEPVTWVADRIVLFRSHLERSGAQYEPVHVASLGA